MGDMIDGIKRWLRWEQDEVPTGPAARLLRRYLLWNNDWYGSHAIRYLPITRLVQRTPRAGEVRLLEVGSADRGIGPFIKERVVAVDLVFHRDNLRRAGGWPIPVCGRIESLPFRDASFEIAVAVDLFEHLPRAVREPAVKEMARVARDRVVIAVPAGQRAREMEERLDRFHRRRFGVSNRWLVEHRQHGLPEGPDLCDMIRQAVPSARVTLIGNAPLALWYVLEWLDIAIPRNYLRRPLTEWLVRLAARWSARRPYRLIVILELGGQ